MKFGCLSKSEVDRKRWALGLATRRKALRASSAKLRHAFRYVEPFGLGDSYVVVECPGGLMELFGRKWSTRQVSDP